MKPKIKAKAKSATKGQGTGILNKKLNFIREMNDEVQRMIEDDDQSMNTADLVSFPQSLANTLKKGGKRNQRNQSISGM